MKFSKEILNEKLHFSCGDRFRENIGMKEYLRLVSEVEIVNAESNANAILVSPVCFVK